LTDPAPFTERVSRGNLDDRLENVTGHVDGLQVLANERWEAHKDRHAELAQSLTEYKSEANEWRATLQDLRLTFIPKAEFQSEHRALEAQIRGLINNNSTLIAALDARMDSVERAIQSINDREITTRSILSSGRNLIILSFTIIGGLIGLALYLRAP
jgi:uncharacterized coiled-coil DUF342 family protein